MRIILQLLLISFILTSCKNITGIVDDIESDRREKKTIKEVFYKNYKTQSHKKYNGRLESTIADNKEYLDFDSTVIVLYKKNEKFKRIFTSGIVSGQLVNKMRADSISICCIEELKYLKENKRQRRFKFWVIHNNFMNPFSYIIELTNKEANRRMPFNEFIMGAELTYINDPWLII